MAKLGIKVHQTGGFDKQGAAKLLNLNTKLFEPATIIAAGFPG